MNLNVGRPADMGMWAELHWVDGPAAVRTAGSLAIRKQRADGLWYITQGYMEDAIVLHGPYPSKEAVEMLLIMDALEF